MAEPGDNTCQSYFDCGDEKTRNLSIQQILMKLVGKTAAGCAALRVLATFSGTVTATPPSTQRTVSRTQDTTIHSSSVAAGARSVSIETSDTFTGTILGVAAQQSRVYDFAVQQNDDTLGAIAYEITAGSIIITKIV